ncbi:MAG: c-type cytochrome [Planctomycetia bacterium]|nr:c-type cytochrome [Planctomycetia bacterium]
MNIADVCKALSTLEIPKPAIPIANCIDVAAAYEDTVGLRRLLTLADRSPTGERSAAAVVVLKGLSRHQLNLARLHHSLSLRRTVDDFRTFIASARASVGDEKAKLSDRATALELFGYDAPYAQEEFALLAKLLSPKVPDELQAGAVAACERYSDRAAVEMLLAAWNGFSPARRSQTLDVCLSRATCAELLVAAVAAKRISPAEIGVARTQALLNHKSAELRQQAKAALQSDFNADRKRVVDGYQAALSLVGDAARGREVFVKSCANCHKLGDLGHAIGPDLMAITDNSPATMLISLFDPNRAVESKYVAYTAETDAGLTYTGVLAAETSNEITLALADGKRQSLLRNGLESFRSSAKSFMPEGLEKDLPPQKVADLLAFLLQRK